MRDSLKEVIVRRVWDRLHRRRWFAKHVDEAEIDSLWEELNDVIDKTIDGYMKGAA